MPDTADHRVEMHRIASERRNAGRPIWDRTINLKYVWRNDALTFEEQRDAIVRIIRASGWLKGRDEFDDLVEVIENLAIAEDVAEFNGWLSDLYDHADYDRVWIATF